MAEKRSVHQSTIMAQMHKAGHASPPPPAPSSVVQDSSASRGPRTLLLRRSENGFGFTLRHFIVYPPESCCMLPGHERTKIDEPMDTIFVKQVRENSPAAEAGLRTGDRVVSVDGVPTRGEQYARVVQRIQQADPWLRLLVVSKEDDILQRYFGETAHNPETNPRPRLRSPERLSQKHRRSMSVIPGATPRTRQSWVCSSLGSENQSCGLRGREEAYKDQKPSKMSVLADTMQRRPLQEARNQESTGLYDRSDERECRRGAPSEMMMDSPSQVYRSSPDSRFDLYDRTRPESIYSRPSSEQIYDRIKDPIYEHVRMRPNDDQTQRLRYPVSRAEPQVPIYRASRRVVTRRASEGSSGATDSEIANFGSVDALRMSDPDSRLSLDDSRRDSSPASKDSLSSYGSNSTLTGNECSDDSVIMTRQRKIFEQKEEFLRRPSHPIGWLLPDDPTRIPKQAVIQREFYARPQKLQRQVWPPGEQRSPTRNPKFLKPFNQHVQRVKTDIDEETTSATAATEYSKSNDGERSSSVPMEDAATARERFYNSSQGSDDCCSKENLPYAGKVDRTERSNAGAAARERTNGINNKAAFVTTLTRIHENVTSNNQNQSQEVRNGASSSLPSSPGPEKKVGDKFPLPPQGLQIVSRRAKQFESGRLLSDDDEPTNDRTNLYKSELSRLSSKRSVPNVAVRKREFESKAESQEVRRSAASTATVTRESKSLDAELPAMEAEPVRLRARSNSAESWEAANGTSRRAARHTWQTDQDEESKRNNNHNNNSSGSSSSSSSNSSSSSGNSNNNNNNSKAKRQDSYLQAVKSQLAPGNGTIGNGVVLRRQKNAQISDEDRATRRVSYLKATSGERMHVDSDLDLSDSEAAIPMPIPAHRSNSIASGTSSGAGTPKDVEPVEREGSLHVKFAVSEGKRSTDRSWKQVWAVLRGPILYFYKDRHSQSPSATNDSDNAGQSMDVRCSSVDIAEDYTKRKHVLRIANLASEVLLQSEDATSMALWLNSLQKHAAAEQALESPSSTSKQQAVPQTPTSTSNASSAGSGQRLSPLPSHKGIRKLTSFRNRSPTGQSPVNKTRKASTTVEPLPSPKTKTWKGRVAKQLRRMHGQAESPSSPTAQLLPGATFKVRLENCPPSTDSEFVPFIVQLCTSIVEARGLEVIGIYRVPGNTAAIAQLTESVNKGFEHINLQDPRWSDVNVISSLLKSFFRQLPDSLFTAELYPMFIDADKIEDPQRRMTTIRKLLRDLPAHHYETLKFLMAHLKKVVDHSEINKMEAKNLAIVFGPTLVRASGSRDNMVTMVTDMSHQCRIVESLLNNVDWFFSDEDLDDLSRLSVSLSLPADGNEAESTSTMNHNLLLNNIQKVEGMREIVSARDIVSSIISAANRKIQRRRKGQDETDHEEPDDEKGKANPNVDNLGTVRQSMALNERQCSVSEIVQMHENKSQTIHTNHPMEQQSDRNAFVVVNHHHHHHHHHNNNNSGSSGSTGTSTSSGSGTGTNNNSNSSGSANNNNNESSTNATISPASRYKNSSSAIVQGFVSDSSSPRGGSLDSATGNFIDGIANSNVSGEKQGNNDDIAIRTYAGLSATTQERIRRFEQETKAMLQRDQHRQRREAEKREEERRRIEMEWQLAKREMENDDILDSIVDNTVSPNFLSDRLASINERLTDRSMADLSERHARSKSSSRMMPLSIAVQQQPTARQKAHASSQLSGILGEKMNNAVIKKFKTDKETSSLDSVSLAPTRYGSLDSLHEVHASPSPSPSQQRGLPGDSSDDGSDLLTSLTSTFDRKWRSLVNPSSQSSQQTCHESCSRAVTESCSDLRQAGRKEDDAAGLSEVYRDPSLHKSVDKNRLSRLKDDVAEKDTDSTVMEDGNEEGNVDSTPDNDKKANLRKSESGKKDSVLDAAEKDENGGKKTTGVPQGRSAKRVEAKPSSSEATGSESGRSSSEVSYSNMLEKFESLSQGSSSESRSRLKRSESLNKRSESAITKLKRSESLNKHSERPTSSPTIAGNSKLKRSESLNKHSADRSESPNSKLKRSESLTKTEKTECNISKRRQSGRKENATKLKRKNGMPERSIKRRHTVGGTKDFDKVHWLDNKLQAEAEKIVRNDCKPKKSQLRTSSPDLSSNRVNVSDASFLIEVSFRGPSNVVFNVTNARPQSLPDASLPSKVFKVPLESHV